MLAVVVPALMSLSAGWVNLFPGHTAAGCPLSLVLGISCVSTGDCFIAGGANNLPGQVYKASDPDFKEVEKLPIRALNVPLICDTIAMKSKTDGVLAAISLKSPGGMYYSVDGASFNASLNAYELSAGQLYATSFGYAFVGEEHGLQGVSVSTDGGLTWKGKWYGSTLVPNGVPRYGAFPSETVWYVTSGYWWRNNTAGQPAYGYVGYIVKTADGGETYDVVFNSTGKYYPNAIACPSETLCVAVGVSTSEQGSAFPGVHVIRTTDGGQSWNETYLFGSTTGGGVFDVKFNGDTEVWVGATDENGATFLHSSDAGKTWSESPLILDIAAIQEISFVNSTLAYAIAETPSGEATVLKYTA